MNTTDERNTLTKQINSIDSVAWRLYGLVFGSPVAPKETEIRNMPSGNISIAVYNLEEIEKRLVEIERELSSIK